MAVQTVSERRQTVQEFFNNLDLVKSNREVIRKVHKIREASPPFSEPAIYRNSELARSALYDPASQRTIVVWNGPTDPLLGNGKSRNFFLGIDEKINRLAIGVLNRKKEKPLLISAELDSLDRLRGIDSIVQTHFVISGDLENYYVQEYCDSGDLMDFVISQKIGRLSQPERLSLLRDIVKGLSEIHAREVIHRDLSLENILLTQIGGRLRAKIGDFGFAFHESDRAAGKLPCGAPLFTSPQRAKIARGKHPERISSVTNKASDLWSLGVVLFQFMTCEYPPWAWLDLEGNLDHLETLKIVQNYKEGDYEAKVFNALQKTGYPPQLIELTSQLLSFQPAERPSAAKVFRELQKLCGEPADEKSMY